MERVDFMAEIVLIKPSVYNQYQIISDDKTFCTIFTPIDLIQEKRYNGADFEIVSGLETIYEKRKELFVKNIDYITNHSFTSKVSNCLPNYICVYEKNNKIFADSVLYQGEFLNENIDDMQFFYKIKIICETMSVLIKETGYEPKINLNCMMFEKNEPWLLHFLYIDFFSDKQCILRSELIDLIIKKVFKRQHRISDDFHIKSIKSNNYHPNIIQNVKKLLHSISPIKMKINDWFEALKYSEEILNILNANSDYFLFPYYPINNNIKSYTNLIKNGYENSNHIVFLCGNNMEQIQKVADKYAVECGENFLHIKKGNAENGLCEMLENKDFELSSSVDTAYERINKMKLMCEDGFLLIIKNLDIEKDAYFKNILKLLANILVLTSNDYSDYGFYCINVKNERVDNK